MQKLLFAIKHKLVVQFRHKPQTTKMKKITAVLDGSEKSMIPIIASNGDTLMGSYKKMIPIEEFSAGTGIADIVLCSYDPAVVKNKKRKPLTDRRVLEAYLLLLKFSEGLSIKNIHTQLGYSQKELKERILPDLYNSGLIGMDNDSYQITNLLNSEGFGKVIAVEAKVRDWRSGFRQAMRYQEFADESYLAVYEKYINPCLGFMKAFQAAGIGLIGVSDEGLKVHIQASNISQYNKQINRLLAQERISTFVNGGNQPFVVREPFATRI
jgi:hypothetical protein